MPAVFFGHGSPMNTLDHNRYTEAWQSFGLVAGEQRPRALLVVSAHWYVNATAVTAMERPRVIHDFFGFPEELFEFDYPAPGAPDVAAEVAEVVKPQWVGLDRDSWGIDHGTWSVLAHAFPEAEVPVVQLSINAQQPLEYHLDLGARLAPLLDSGVVIVGSGNVVHNLRLIDWRRSDVGFDWAHRFDDAARQVMLDDPAQVGRLGDHGDFGVAVPTPDHFLPLLYVAGVAAATGRKPEVLVDGYTFGSLSMTCYTVGATGTATATSNGEGGGGGIPDPAVVPPDETNI